MPLFDRYIAVDWSANNSPKSGKDSIWSALASHATGEVQTENHPTRHAAETWVLRELIASVRAGQRVLTGLDFPYGYPNGFAAALGGDGTPWQDTWRYIASRIEDDEHNISNRFQVAAEINAKLGHNAPFWGRPAHLALPDLPAKKAVVYRGASEPGGLSEWRQAEEYLHRLRTTPQSVWKLAYNGSVGSQTLVGIPVLHRLRNHDDLRNVSHVWPFEVGVPSLPPGIPAVIHAEIWPSIVPFDHESGSCRDEQQVRAVVKRWRELDGEDRLGDWFSTPDDDRVRREEGWVLGVPSALPSDGPDRPTHRSTAQKRPPRSPQPAVTERMPEPTDRLPCLCGCGSHPRGKRSRFMSGHDQRHDPATGRPFNAH
jgi:precorrin-8X/cobalt-precorrin-8 methylmutase